MSGPASTPAAAPKWSFVERNYETEPESNPKLQAQPVSVYPLHPQWGIIQKSQRGGPKSKLKSSGDDYDNDEVHNTNNISNAPLSGAVDDPSASADFLDPLLVKLETSLALRQSYTEKQLQHAVIEAAKNEITSARRKGPDSFLNWAVKKKEILKKYTTDKKLPVVSKIVDDDDAASTPRMMPSSTTDERVKQRLEQLEREEQTSVQYLTQSQTIRDLERLNEELIAQWSRENRVEALKIAIMCSKTLGRNAVPQFYPSVFVLVVEVLDSFGRLVFERLKQRSEVSDSSAVKIVPLGVYLGEIKAADIPEEAKETTRNWFYKIASIRELLPRLYVEMAILKSNKFLSDDESHFKSDLDRMTRMIRGIGDPLIAMHARCFLAKKGFELLPTYKDYLMTCFEDFLFSQRQWEAPAFQKVLYDKHGLSVTQYLDLFAPAIEMLLETLGNNADEKLFHHVVEKYEQNCNKSLVLNAIISSFEAHIVSNSASLLVFLINESDGNTLPHYVLFRSLGKKFAICPPIEKQKLLLLNEVWRQITHIENLHDYISIAEIWVEYVVKNFTDREVNILLGDIRKHLGKESKSLESFTVELVNILCTVLDNMADFNSVLAMDHFLPIMDVLRASSRSQVCRGVLTVFTRQQRLESDPVIINAMFDIARTVHDHCISAISSSDERTTVSALISRFISMVDFGRDFELQLNFFTECRGAFSNLDSIQDSLVLNVLNLATKTLKLVRGKHSKKTAAFVKACMAFCHITIPSIVDPFTRLRLYVLAGQVALMNNVLPQADIFFRATISTIPEVPTVINDEHNKAIFTEDRLLQFLCMFASVLVTVPGHPEHGPLYIVRRLLNTIQEYPWPTGSDGKIRFYTHMLAALAAMRQDRLPYHVKGATANDDLFMGDEAYKSDIASIANTILEEIVTQINALSTDTDVSAKIKQTSAALDLINVLIGDVQLNAAIGTLLDKLFKMCQDNLVRGSNNSQMQPLENYFARSQGYLNRKKALLVASVNR